MPTLAGWITGEQVPNQIIEQTLTTMGTVLKQHGGNEGRIVQPGFGLITFSEPAYALSKSIEAPVLDWVPDRRTLVYRRPLSGTHVLYYIADWPAEGNLLFATEIKALLAVGVPRRLHLAALDALLRYGFIPAPWTAFQGVCVVPAGSILRWQKAKTVMNSAADYSFDQLPFDTDTLDTLHTLLDKTTAALLPPHEQLVSLIDMGIASALLTSLAAHHVENPFTVVTIDYKKGRKDGSSSEAERLAFRYQFPLLAIMGLDAPEFWTATIAALEAPCVDSTPLALHQLLHTTSVETSARVAISGLGARALFGTTLSSLTEKKREQQDVLAWHARDLSIQPGTNITRLWSKDTAQLISREESWEQTLHAKKLARKAMQFPEDWQRRYYLNLHLDMPDLMLGPAGQLAATERIALRFPYLATDVMNLITRLSNISQDGTSKEDLLEGLAKKLLLDYRSRAGVKPTQPPLRIAETLKAPTASLLRMEDSELLQQSLSQEALRETGIFDLKVVQSLLKQKPQDGGMAPRELLLVFTTQLLCRMFGVRL